MRIQESNNGIYHQIAEYGMEQVLAGEWSNGDRIPSVRQLAAEIGVNPNTVMSAYEQLKEHDIIHTLRGRGFYVTDEGRERAVALRRAAFVREEIPTIRRNLSLLNISIEEFTHLLDPSTIN